MVSVIRVGQSKFVTVSIDEDSNERIMNCIQTLSDLGKQPAVQEVFLKDTKAAYSKMIAAQEVCISSYFLLQDLSKFISRSLVEKGR
jgi:coatomer subunit beta